MRRSAPSHPSAVADLTPETCGWLCVLAVLGGEHGVVARCELFGRYRYGNYAEM